MIVLAVPVAPRHTAERLRRLVEDVVVLDAPEEFFAVGEFYESFPQVSDEEVKAALSESHAAA